MRHGVGEDTFCGVPFVNCRSNADSLNAQVRRMLQDERSSSLVDSFFGQWLTTRNLSASRPDPQVFPEFDDNLREAFQQELALFLESQVREREIGVRLQELVDKHFVLPEISDAGRVFFNSVEIARLLASLGQIEHGYITDVSADEAFRAQISYLQQYIPPTLKRRG